MEAKLSDIDHVIIFVAINGEYYPVVPKQGMDAAAAEFIRYTMMRALFETHGITNMPTDLEIINSKKEK